MRALAAMLLGMSLAAAPMLAGNPKEAGKEETPAAVSTTPAAAEKSAAAVKPEISAVESEMQDLRSLVEEQRAELESQRAALKAQQLKMETLEEKLGTTGENLSASPAMAAVAAPAASASAGTLASASLASPAPAMSPAPGAAAAQDKNKLGPIATQDFKIGVTFYGGWSYYNSTGYSMQFLDTPTKQLPPGNNGFNTFEVNRAYVNLQYTPDERVTLRVTPDIYRQSDGSYGFRLKYGYVDFQKIFGSGAFKKDKLTFGQTQQPLTDWEEGLSGYRYAYLTPWNYVSLSSTWVGAKLHGPIEFNGKEYLDYDFGVFNNASFHAVETNETKQFMARVTAYPFGTTSDRTGLGFTFFNDFGYKGALPSDPQTSLDRLSAIVSYQTHDKADQIVFEYQWGHNAFSTGNLFNGAGTPSGSYDAFATDPNTGANTILSGSTHQRGFALFGHARLGHSPFQLFGLYQYFQPNTDFDYKGAGLTANPIDWAHTVGGISYSVTKQFTVAIGDENFHWVHPQVATTGIPTGGDTNGIVIWTQFNY